MLIVGRDRQGKKSKKKGEERKKKKTLKKKNDRTVWRRTAVGRIVMFYRLESEKAPPAWPVPAEVN